MDVLSLILATLIVFVGAAAQASIGMGLNLFSIPLLLLVNPNYSPGSVLLASMLLAFLALLRVPAKIEWLEFKYAFAGLLGGTVIASVIVSQMETTAFVKVLGLLVIFSVCLILSGWSVRISNLNLSIAGSAAGLLGTIAGVHAPPIALLYQGQSPDRIRGALLTFVGIGNGLSVAALYFAGRFGLEQLGYTLALLPGVLLGLWFAPVLTSLLSISLIRCFVLTISAVSGFSLVIG